MSEYERGMVVDRTSTVNDISDRDLIERVVRSGQIVKTGGEPRWVRVMGLFGLGSTYATQLCRRYGVDPDDRMKR